MRKRRYSWLLMMSAWAMLQFCGATNAQTRPWVSAYLCGWEMGDGSNGYLPLSAVDFTAMTHVIHFAIEPNSNGTIDAASNTITSAGAKALTTAAHAVGTKVLISVGGWSTEQAFMGATSSSTLSTFVANLVSFMKSNGYDGIDIDWEPINQSDYTQFKALMHALRTALGTTYILTTTASDGNESLMAAVQSDVDQINIMTYDLSWNAPGWVTWYNGGVHQNGVTFQSTGGPVPACDNIVAGFVAAGVAVGKIGIGSEFGGSVWTGGVTTSGNGVTGPNQAWTTTPDLTSDVPLYAWDGSGIMQKYFTPQRYHWDSGAQASYLSIDNSGTSNDRFISYDDTNDVNAKFTYIRQQGLGGMIIWSLGMGYPGNGTYPLLQVVKRDLGGGTVPPSPDTTRPSVAVSSPSNGATVSGTVAIAATATDNIGVASVKFSVDGTQLGNPDVTPPYTVSWVTGAVANGSHVISATAVDAAGNTASASVTVSVLNSTSAPDTAAPTLVSPANNATGIPTPVTLVWKTATATAHTFRLQVSSSTTFSPTVVDTSIASGDSATIGELSQGTKYYWRVDATVSGITGGWSSVRNFTTPPAGPITGTIDIYQEALASPWMNTSWSATVNFNYPGVAYSGTQSIRVSQGAWGALSLHYGDWNDGLTLSPAQVGTVKLMVYSLKPAKFDMLLENSQGASFPEVSLGSVPAKKWTALSVPVATLDPAGIPFDRIDLMEVSGKSITYYVDAYQLTSTQQYSSPMASEEQTPNSPPTLAQNYPNPFNPSTVIQYTVATENIQESGSANVKLAVYDVLGRQVSMLVNEKQAPGTYAVRFDGSRLASGMYFYRLTIGSAVVTRSMILTK